MNETEKYCADKIEGKVFVHIFLINLRDNGKNYSIFKDYYTVKDGIVYLIEKDQSLYRSDDTCFDILTECRYVGKYNPNKKYIRKVNNIGFDTLKRLMQK